jgi:hypothetical protein
MKILNGQKEGAEIVVAQLMFLFYVRFNDYGDVGDPRRKKLADSLNDQLPKWALE